MITYKGIVFIPGIRIDIMDPMSQYRVLDPNRPGGLQFIPISSPDGFADASVKFQFSPRINVNYPLTERSYISLSYGQFFQSPMADYLYNLFNTEILASASNAVIGDPNMEAQKTNQYELSYQNQITDEFAFSVTTYFKDIYNQLGVLQVQTTPEAYFQ